MTGPKVQLMAEHCSTCVFRPGNPMSLEAGRLADLIRENLNAGAALVCHQSLSYGDHPEMGETLCRGFYDSHGDEAQSVQVYERLMDALDGTTEKYALIEPPKKVSHGAE